MRKRHAPRTASYPPDPARHEYMAKEGLPRHLRLRIPGPFRPLAHWNSLASNLQTLEGSYRVHTCDTCSKPPNHSYVLNTKMYLSVCSATRRQLVAPHWVTLTVLNLQRFAGDPR